MDLAQYIRNVPDFPVAGIQFKDITTLLQDPVPFAASVEALLARYKDRGINIVVGIESRGFIWGAILAYEMGAGFVPVRKPGKLPAAHMSIEYALEYGQGQLDIHSDAMNPGDTAVIVDDLLATGGTASGTARLVEMLGARVAGIAFLIELSGLGGRKLLTGYDVYSMIAFD